MTITIRPAASRGVSNLGWLQSQHSFSFGEYYDPKHRSFETLRVINDDKGTVASLVIMSPLVNFAISKE